MKTYREYSDFSNSWLLFNAVLQNPEDDNQMLILADALGDQGFDETAKLVRSRVSGESSIYWNNVASELKNHGLIIKGQTLKWIPENKTINGWQEFRVTHSEIQIKTKKGWVQVSKPYVDIVPGLVVLWVQDIRQHHGHTYGSRLYLAYLGQYTNELRKISATMESLIERGSEFNWKYAAGIPKLAKKIEDLIKRMQTIGVSAMPYSPYNNMIESLRYVVWNIQQMLEDLGAQPNRELASLMTYLGQS